MNAVKDAVLLMSKEEMRAFKLFAQRVHSAEGRKDFELFDYIRDKEDKYSEDEIAEELYPGSSRNTFHRLKSRLLKEVNKSQIILKIDTNDTLKLYHLLSISEFYMSRNAWELADHYLRKSERAAIRLENFQILDIIYHLFIQLSHHVLSIDPEEIMDKRRDNYEKLSHLREIEDILAAISHRIRITQNFGGSSEVVHDILEETIRKVSVNEKLADSPSFRFKVFEAVSKILLDKQDYEALSEYLLATYQVFNKKGYFTESRHKERLQMLTYLVNSLFKTRDYDQSIKYAGELEEQMQRFGGKFREQYEFFHYNALVINYSQTDIDKAIDVLNDMKSNPRIQKTPFHMLFVYMNLAILNFNKEKYSTAIRHLVRIYILDGYKSASAELKLSINIAELLIRFRLTDYQLVYERISQIKKDFDELLKLQGHSHDRQIIRLLSEMCETPGFSSDKALKRKARALSKDIDRSFSGGEKLIDYSSFLKESFGQEN